MWTFETKKAGSVGLKAELYVKRLRIRLPAGYYTETEIFIQQQRRDVVRFFYTCDQHPFSGILVQWCLPPYSVIFFWETGYCISWFLSCISRLQKVPGTNFITLDVLVLLLLTYYSVTLLKTILSCRFIYLLHLPNSHQWICLRLITSSQTPIVILWCCFTNIIAGSTSRQRNSFFEKYINYISVANITLLLQILPLHELSAVIRWFPIRTLYS